MGKTDAGKLTRREFLAGMGVASAAVVGAGALAGCAPDSAATGSDPDPGPGAANANTSDAILARQHAAKLNPQDPPAIVKNDADLSALFTEWQFGPLTLPNRIVKSAAGTSAQSYKDGITNAETIDYYVSLAKQGVKLMYMDDICVQYEHFFFPPGFPPFNKITDWTPEQMTELVAAVHAEGAYFGYQLATLGAFFENSSPDMSLGSADFITHDEIELLTEDIIQAAVNLKSYGFDAVEINAAGSNLGQNFMSRHRNHRTDEYGPQSIESRCLFVTTLLKGIKERCGADFPVQVLMNGVEDNDARVGQNAFHTTVEEATQMAKLFEAAGADSLHIRLGPSGEHICEFASELYFTGYGIEGTTSFGSQFDFQRHWEGKLKADQSGMAIMTPIAAEIKKSVSIPVGCVTYMDPAHDPEFFNGIIADGTIDFMLMNRPLNVDREYLIKLQEGRLDEIAPCTRCLHCYVDMDVEGHMFYWCRVNAAFYRAFRDNMPEGYDPIPIAITADGSKLVNSMPEGPEPLPAATPKKVMVIGGGPAGMEAARVAAERGHTVTLYEKGSTLGGLLTFADVIKGSHENLGALIAYLSKQLELKGVTVVTDTEVTADTISSEAPEAVILASGGLRDTLGLADTTSTKIVSMDNFITSEIGENVVIVGYDKQAVDIAQYLQAQGKRLHILTQKPLDYLDYGQSAEVRKYTTPMIFALGGHVWPEAEITAVGEGEITFTTDAGIATTVACDTIIEAMDMLPNTSLVDGLGIEAYVAGDCMNPYNIANAITSGNFCARAV
jgi:2,4-dienoyl-CoA reductase-like NADH-dependent reductase (Old Yellow Enzyme family)/thioredoxin reductase